MPLVRESVDRGVVTARDPALLNPGEVQRAINCIYRPNSPGLWKAPGRSIYNSAAIAASPIKGVRFLAFDDAHGVPTNIILAYNTTSYYSSALTAETGVFALLAASVGNGATLDSVYYQNRHYLFNGNRDGVANFVAKISETTGAVTTRPHGLNVSTQLPTLASAAGEGWPATTDFGTGYYFFFTTEVVNPDSGDEVESALATTATPPSIFLSNLTNGVTVTLPTVKDNATATHRRIYVVGPKDSSIWNPFFLVEARRLITVDVAQTSVIFGLNATSVTQESKNPNATVSSPGWTNPNNTFTADNLTARADFNGNQLVQSCASFTPAAAIQGIEVAIRCQSWGVVGTVSVELSWNAGANWTAPVFLDFSKNIFFTFPKVGARNYRWGRTWAAGDLTAANFRIRITTQGGAAGAGQFAIDVVNVIVYSGASLSTEPIKGAYYPTTSAKIGPTVTVISANTPPPVSSTGDIFESCLVVNDVNEPQTIRFSTVESPDYFPSIYFVSLRGKQGDKVVFIRRVNGILVVGMSQSLYRVNYLPTADSIELGRGICYEAIAEDHGIISTQGATIFTPAGSAEQLAYVSAVGLRYTDGLHTDTLSEDLDWPNTVNISKLDKCVLVNEPNLSTLVLYYIPAGDNTSTVPTRALYFSYHPSKIKENGKLAVAGPVTVDVASSTIAFLNNLPLHLTGNSTGTLNIEDRGSGSQEVDIVLRDIFPDGFGSSFRVRKHWLRVAQHDPGVITTIIPYTKDHDADYDDVSASTVWLTKSFRNNFVRRIPGDTLTPRNLSGFAKLSSDFMAESYALRVVTAPVPGQANGDFALQMIAYDAVDKGEHNTK